MDQQSQNHSVEALGYAQSSHQLASLLSAAINDWEKGDGAAMSPTDCNWRIAEALHLLTWLRPHTHAPLSLLQDEERSKLGSVVLSGQ